MEFRSVNFFRLKGLLFVVMLASAWEYARWTVHNAGRAAQIVYMDERPYVYRMLIPFFAWLLVQTGVTVETALRIVVMLSVIGLFYAFLYLFRSFRRS